MAKKSEQILRTVSAVSVIDLANELLCRGYIDESFLEKMGTNFRTLYSAWKNKRTIQEARLPEHLLTGLWAAAAEHELDSHVGLDIGYKVNYQARGLLANWMFQCSTLAEAFNIFSNNIYLLNPSEYWEKFNDDDSVKLILKFKTLQYPSIAIDRSMASIVSWSSALSGTNIKPNTVSFSRSKPKSVDKYKQIFGENVAFGQKENLLVFPASVFEYSITDANPYLRELLEKQALEISTNLCDTETYTHSVNRLLRKNLPKYCQIEPICKALHLSRSTLYRKLKSEGTSYSQLVLNARIRKLKHIENTLDNHEVIAETLGFQDSGSYYRFRKSNFSFDYSV